MLRNGAVRWKQAYNRFFQKLGRRPTIQRKVGKKPQRSWRRPANAASLGTADTDGLDDDKEGNSSTSSARLAARGNDAAWHDTRRVRGSDQRIQADARQVALAERVL
ncbi:hypothetical protein [Cupriavidus sp. CuC1]|uniref:hypothetical protein n=1 Tax=Cupriavidus sp. CuC1 TaxID=3373131 RepID=UPI0037D54D44